MLPAVRKALLALAADEPWRGKRILVAVSGGADSVALLRALHALRGEFGFRLAVGHVNHGLRGAESDADQVFVERLARRLRLPVQARRVDPGARRTRGVSLEMACRALRRDVLAEMARAAGATRIALGHHRRDQAETVLLRLCRGTGLGGLGAMEPAAVRDGLWWIRPLLDLDPARLRAGLRRLGQAWREDSSNASDDPRRNRVRLHVLPLLEREINPAAVEHLAALAAEARAERGWREAECETLRARVVADGRLHLDALRRAPLAPARLVLLRWLAEAGLPPERQSRGRVGDLLGARRRSARFDLPAGRRLVLADGWLSVAAAAKPEEKPGFRCPLPAPGRVSVIRELGVSVRVRRDTGFQRAVRTTPGALPAVVWLPADRAQGLVFRPWRAGDRVTPVGATGSRKLQDIFTDAKLTRSERARVPVLAAESGVVWVPGGWLDAAWTVPGPSSPSWRVELRPVKV